MLGKIKSIVVSTGKKFSGNVQEQYAIGNRGEQVAIGYTVEITPTTLWVLPLQHVVAIEIEVEVEDGQGSIEAPSVG